MSLRAFRDAFRGSPSGSASVRGRGAGRRTRNHALRPEAVEWESLERLAAIYPSSRARLLRAQALLADGAEAEAVLADHDGSPASACHHLHPSEPTRTAASVVLECVGRSAAIALGLPCETPYARVAL